MKKFHTSLNRRLEWVAVGLEKTQPQIAEALRKWRPFIFDAARRVAKITHGSEEDALGEILLAVASVCELYRSPLYRYEGSLYRIVDEDGNAVLIETPKTTKKRRCFWVDRELLTAVKRSKIESFVYQRIKQHYVNSLKAIFTEKRGFNSTTGMLPFTVDVDIPEQEEKDPSRYPSAREVRERLVYVEHPESALSFSQLLHGITLSISQRSEEIFSVLMEDPSATDVKISHDLGYSQRSVKAARLEILRAFFQLEGETVVCEGVHPIYMRADQLW